MKKSILSKGFFLVYVVLYLMRPLHAQPCTPGSYTSPWLHPDTISNFSLAVANLNYNQLVTIVVPTDTNLYGFLIVVDSFNISNISGLPSGFTYVSNSNNDTWVGGVSGCLMISGMASYSQIGVYPVTFHTHFYGGGMQVPVDYSGYYLEIVDTVYANCFDTLDANVIDTCFSFIPYSGYIESFSYNGTDSVIVSWVVSSYNNTQQATVYASYPVDANGCHVMGITIECSKSTTYYFTDQLLFTDIVTGSDMRNYFEPNVFPNPASDYITVSVDSRAEVEIINIRGEVISRIKINDFSERINITHLSEGFYILRIYSGKSTVLKKFIKI